MVLTTHLFLVPSCELVGAIFPHTVCACIGMSWGDLPLTLEPLRTSYHFRPVENILQITWSANSLHFPPRLIEYYLQINDMFFQIFLEVLGEYTLKSIVSLDMRSWMMLSNFTP